MSSCKIEHEGEKFEVKLSEDKKQAIVIDSQGAEVTIGL